MLDEDDEDDEEDVVVAGAVESEAVVLEESPNMPPKTGWMAATITPARKAIRRIGPVRLLIFGKCGYSRLSSWVN